MTVVQSTEISRVSPSITFAIVPQELVKGIIAFPYASRFDLSAVHE
ncbi:MAG: hypothetical protein ACRD8Z_19630 [Nitrososphaeraceae archaeon]